MKDKHKYLICISKNESCDGVIRFAINHIKKYNTKIELLMVVPSSNILRIFVSGGSDQADFTERNNAKKYLSTIAHKIQSETKISKIEQNVYSGDLTKTIEEKLLLDSDICAILLGADTNSWKKNHNLSNMMAKIFSFSTIPVIIIPQNITDQQIDNLLIS